MPAPEDRLTRRQENSPGEGTRMLFARFFRDRKGGAASSASGGTSLKLFATGSIDRVPALATLKLAAATTPIVAADGLGEPRHVQRRSVTHFAAASGLGGSAARLIGTSNPPQQVG
jgi:hypothetical protein